MTGNSKTEKGPLPADEVLAQWVAQNSPAIAHTRQMRVVRERGLDRWELHRPDTERSPGA